jgi:hypothetical protein
MAAVYRFQLIPNILKHPLTHTMTSFVAEAGFVVKINFYAGVEISGQFLHSSPMCLELDFLSF